MRSARCACAPARVAHRASSAISHRCLVDVASGTTRRSTGSRRAPRSPRGSRGSSSPGRLTLDGGDRGVAARARPWPARGSSSSPRRRRETSYAVKPNGTVLWQRSLGTVVTNGNCGTYGIELDGRDRREARPPLRRRRDRDAARSASHRRQRRRRLARSRRDPHADRVRLGRAAPRRRPPLRPRRLVLRRTGSSRRARRRPARCVRRRLAVGTAPSSFDPVPGADNLGGVWGWGGVSVTTAGRRALHRHRQREPDVDNGSSDSMVELDARSVRGRRVRPARRGARRGHRSRRGAGALPAARLSGAPGREREDGRASRLAPARASGAARARASR